MEAGLRIIRQIADIPPAAWNRLAGPQPCVQHAYLHALEASGCVSAASGWQPQHLTLWREGELIAAMPLYLKSHSWGEYVFDWAWAEAYEHSGLAYYPKLLSAVPFTPVTGPRLLAEDEASRSALLAGALQLARQLGVSSLHCLFPEVSERSAYENAGLMIRDGVQFHWRNAGYADFDDFLAAMNHDKRKKIRQERRKLAEQGIVFRHLSGASITAADWAFFYDCYSSTYRQHRSTPYLTQAFFESLGLAMPQQMLLIVASRDGKDIATAFNLLGEHTMYGRYWGARETIPGLHFETCYYQAIAYCIAHGIATFEGGAQGEHKLARGLLPTPTYSAHWLAQPEFAEAIDRYLARESQHVALYIDELNEHRPFKT
jgi:predicted N-acyltransferase